MYLKEFFSEKSGGFLCFYLIFWGTLLLSYLLVYFFWFLLFLIIVLGKNIYQKYVLLLEILVKNHDFVQVFITVFQIS